MEFIDNFKVDTLENNSNYKKDVFKKATELIENKKQTLIDLKNIKYKEYLPTKIKKWITGINFDLNETDKLINEAKKYNIKDKKKLETFREICDTIKKARDVISNKKSKHNKLMLNIAMKNVLIAGFNNDKYKFLEEKQKLEIELYNKCVANMKEKTHGAIIVRPNMTRNEPYFTKSKEIYQSINKIDDIKKFLIRQKIRTWAEKIDNNISWNY